MSEKSTIGLVTASCCGSCGVGQQRTEVPVLRREEQVRAAKAVGVQDARFLGYANGAVEVTLDLRCDLSRMIRKVRPRRVVMHRSEINWLWLPDFHSDHRAVGAEVHALRAHVSQTAHLADLEKVVRSRLAAQAAPWGIPARTAGPG